MRYTLLLGIIVLLLSCSDKKASLVSKYLNSNNIPVQKLIIHVTKDTSLVLKGGTKLHIPKGTLKTKDNQPAVLQVKEVLSPEQILAAGMFTESNGKPLSSGGMILIDADSSIDVELAGKIIAEIPAKTIDERMQLFKGEQQDNGTVNWTDPEPIAFNKTDSNDIGRQLFMQNCASCHHPTKRSAGPPLAGADSRVPDKNELYKFIRNPAAAMSESHYAQYFCEVRNLYGGVLMPGFPSLTDKEIDAIINYANKEAIQQSIDPANLVIPEIDSCQQNTAEYDLLRNARDSLQASRKPFITVTNIPDTSINATILPGTPTIWEPKLDMVDPENFIADYYRIEIETFGWYNIDHFIEDAQDSELLVKLTGTHSNKNQVFLVIPSIKMMVQGGFLDDGSNYGFYTKDGKLPLLQGLDAFILVMGESPDNPQLYFGQTKFVTSASQMVSVNMKPLSQEQLHKNFNYFNFADFKAEVKRDSTKENIQSLDEKMEKLRGKMKHCDCPGKIDTVTFAAR